MPSSGPPSTISAWLLLTSGESSGRCTLDRAPTTHTGKSRITDGPPGSGPTGLSIGHRAPAECSAASPRRDIESGMSFSLDDLNKPSWLAADCLPTLAPEREPPYANDVPAATRKSA